MISLAEFVKLFSQGLKLADGLRPEGSSRTRTYRPGIGPLTEKRAIELAVEQLVQADPTFPKAKPRRYPDSRRECDLVIQGQWALEFKLLRPFGDNGKEAEHWAKNILYPYRGTTGAIGDCLKLLESDFPERKAVIAFGYEHTPPRIALEPAIRAFELIAEQVVGIDLGPRSYALATGLIHPHHEQALVYGWEVLSHKSLK